MNPRTAVREVIIERRLVEELSSGDFYQENFCTFLEDFVIDTIEHMRQERRKSLRKRLFNNLSTRFL